MVLQHINWMPSNETCKNERPTQKFFINWQNFLFYASHYEKKCTFSILEKSKIYWFYKSFLLILWVNMLIMCTGMAFGSGYLSLTSGRPNKVLFIGFRVRLNCDILATLTHSHFVTIKCGPKTYQQQLTHSFTGSHLRKPVSW